jgi:hypothetical protein
MQPYLWNSLYRNALHEANPRFRVFRINVAIDLCVRCLREIGVNSFRRIEQQGLFTAISDLRLLAHLHRKYSWPQRN